MILPEPLANIFLQHIEVEFLMFKQYEFQQAQYKLFVNHYWENGFNINMGEDDGSWFKEGLSSPDESKIDNFFKESFPNLTVEQLKNIKSKSFSDFEAIEDEGKGNIVHETKRLPFNIIAKELIDIFYKSMEKTIDFNELIESREQVMNFISIENYCKLQFKSSLEKELVSKHIKNKKPKI